MRTIRNGTCRRASRGRRPTTTTATAPKAAAESSASASGLPPFLCFRPVPLADDRQGAYARPPSLTVYNILFQLHRLFLIVFVPAHPYPFPYRKLCYTGLYPSQQAGQQQQRQPTL